LSPSLSLSPPLYISPLPLSLSISLSLPPSLSLSLSLSLPLSLSPLSRSLSLSLPLSLSLSLPLSPSLSLSTLPLCLYASPLSGGEAEAEGGEEQAVCFFVAAQQADVSSLLPGRELVLLFILLHTLQTESSGPA